MVLSPLTPRCVQRNLPTLICSIFLAGCGGDASKDIIVGSSADDIANAPIATAITEIDNSTANLQARAENSQFSIEDTGTNLSISVSYQDVVAAAHTQIFLNTDNDTSTGFGFNGAAWGAIGADYMIQDQYLFKSLGNTSDWDWQAISKIESYAHTDGQIEMAISKSLVGNPCSSLQAGTMGRNDSWGVEVMYPVSTELMSVPITPCLEDVTRPVVNLIGDPEITITQGDTFIDPGATAIDNVDGDISSAIYTDGSVNSAIVGSYSLVYISTDSAGNVAISRVRKVTVVESDVPLPPVSLNGNWDLLVNKQVVYDGGPAMKTLSGYQDVTTKDIYLELKWGYGSSASHIQIYLDTDNDPSTGYQVWNSPTPTALSGAEYLIEDGRMTKYTGTGNNWSWSNEVTDTPFIFQHMPRLNRTPITTIKSIFPSSMIVGDTVVITLIEVQPDWSRYNILTAPSIYTIRTPDENTD